MQTIQQLNEEETPSALAGSVLHTNPQSMKEWMRTCHMFSAADRLQQHALMSEIMKSPMDSARPLAKELMPERTSSGQIAQEIMDGVRPSLVPID